MDLKYDVILMNCDEFYVIKDVDYYNEIEDYDMSGEKYISITQCDNLMLRFFRNVPF